MRVFPKGQGFTVGLLGVLALAWLWPEGGRAGGDLYVEYTTKAAVFIIFLLQGLNLPLGQLLRGFSDWRLHLFVQLFGFAFFPLAMLGMVALGIVPKIWAPGFLFLAILPTTISTAIVYTSSSGGDSAGATFNATLSNLLGIFFVPAWCAMFVFPQLTNAMNGGSAANFFTEFLAKLLVLIVIPLCIGMAVRPFFGKKLQEMESVLRKMSFCCVLFIAFAGFCQGFLGVSTIAERASWWQALGWSLVILAGVKFVAWYVPSWLGFTPAQRLAAFFCGSQKSLAVGLPMGQLLFGLEHPQFFTLMLPLIIYHMIQLLVGGIIIGRVSTSVD